MNLSLNSFLAVAALVSCVMACDTSTSSGNTSSDLASQTEVSRCQDSCDKQRFFDCVDAAEHAGCYDDCASADAASIDKFNGCVENTTCDAACSVNIQGKSGQVSEEERVDTGREPAPSASTCESACASMVADMCVPPSCSQACADSELSFQVVYCNQVRRGCDFPEACGGAPSPKSACEEECEQMQFFDCLDASQAISCRMLCGDAAITDDARTSFASCVDAASGCDQACYKALDPDFMPSPSVDVAGCQDACDTMNFSGCIDSTDLSNCRRLCASASNDSVESFKACTQGFCEDASCYETLIASN